MGNFWVPFFSTCTSRVVEQAIKTAEEEIRGDGKPSLILKNLTLAIEKVDLAPKNLFQLDKIIESAVNKQVKAFNITLDDDSERDGIAKNFTSAVMELDDKVLGSADAFVGLPLKERHEVINGIQMNVDATLHLLAENMVEQKYINGVNNLRNF